LFIILLTAIPGSAFPRLPDFMDLIQPDKGIHLFVFGVYVFLQVRGFTLQESYPAIRKNAVLYSLSIGLFLGAGTELLQEFVIPNRLGSIYDFAANVAGCLAGWGVSRKFIIHNSPS
jgi:VanZ family protein